MQILHLKSDFPSVYPTNFFNVNDYNKYKYLLFCIMREYHLTLIKITLAHFFLN